MHFNYHFLKFLCPVLESKYKGLEILECFSQNKDELIIGCGNENETAYIRANFLPSISCLGFPEDFKRGKKNTISLFPQIAGQKIEAIQVVKFERSFIVTLDSGNRLLFKLHGNRSNFLFYEAGTSWPSLLFRNELKDDKEINMDEIDQQFDLGYERFSSLQGNASQYLPTLGKIPREWLKEKGYITAPLDEKWALMQQLLDVLESPFFSIIKKEQQYLLSLLPEEDVIFQTVDPIKACNELFRYLVVIQGFEKEKNQWLRNFEDQQKRTRSYISKSTERLETLESGLSPAQLADVIMANLHQIAPGQEEAVLFNFYTQKEETIKLKRGQSPQKLAENLYRKSKNRKIEIEQLYQNLENKENQLRQTENWIQEIQQINDYRSLKGFVKRNQLTTKSKEQEEQVPFKRFEVEGFEILVGKSSKSNDDMLRYYAWKEDLWLHAKDVSGSHVLIKYRSGLKFSKTLIERAAELAAYYSKNRNNTMAPVICTPVKFVRKVKGSAPGAVVVDKETVMMVVPKGPKEES